MHIRKLELQGFKSFPERTTFHFSDGISGVVGPNGCGKSNVVDAVKWCLGEQSARSLRGQAMQDVIFAGSEDRMPLGLAEVSLTFTASETEFPGDFARYEEIQVSRRLYRDGQSEYLINQNKVRLKDIQELFMDSGAANRLYSFIEQGRIGEIVNARPEQRRSLIEEAAGISRYKSRRKEAESRLGGTLQNLERVTTLVEDLGSRLRSLERQVGRAMRYRRLRSFIRQAEITLGLARFSGLVADRKALAEELRGAENREGVARREVERAEVKIHESRAGLETLETTVGQIRDELAELEASRREQTSARQYQDRERLGLIERQGRIDEQMVDLKASGEAAAERLLVAIRDRQAAEIDLGAADSALAEHRQRVETAGAQVKERRSRIEQSKSGILQRVKTSAANEAQVQASAQRKLDLEARQGRVRKRRQDAGSEMEKFLQSVEEEKARLTEAMAGLESARTDLKTATERVEGCRVGSDEARKALGLAERRVAEQSAAQGSIQARLESLESLLAAHEGVEDDLRDIMQMQGVRGSLAEHLDVSAELEPGLVTALGPALDAILVDDDALALQVAQNVQGRVGIISLAQCPAPTEGFVSQIGGTLEGRAALAMLLNGCEQAETLGQAISSSRQSARPCVVVSGDVHAFVDSNGLLLVGPPRSGGAAILARRRQVVELQEELDQKSSALVDARQALELIRSGMAEALQQQELAERALATESTRLAALELEQREALRRQDELEREQGRQRIMAQRIAAESTEVEEALKNLDALVEERLDAARRARSEQVGLEQELQVEQAELLSEMKLLESARVDLNTKAAEAAALRERLVGLKRSESEVAELRDGSLSQIKAFENERQAAIARVQQLVDDDARLEKLLEEIGTGQGELSQRLTVGQEQLSTERSAMATKEQALRETLKAREAVTAERMELDRRVLRVRDEIERIRQQLEDRYQVSVAGMLDQMERSGHVIIEVDPAAIREDLPACARPGERDKKLIEEVRVVSSMLDDEASVNSWVERLQRAREEFERLGEVNLVALREYTEVAERHDSLEGQRKDLEDSVQAIRHSIGRLNRISRERFRETFDAVDTYFREIYPRLVGGGSARLELTDEEDLLETGVDIYVQPPGKRLQNLSLLSGGETAMVAIALIFSLFRVKPSPFCLLDEVDAPLDEGNGARFNSMLREMAQLSQFIVITHNKKTMECMDTLYGVTMPLPGVSRLVSVQLD